MGLISLISGSLFSLFYGREDGKPKSEVNRKEVQILRQF